MAKRKFKYSTEPDEKLMKRKRLVREIIIWIVEALLVVAVAWLICFYILEKTSVIGDSMSPTLAGGDQILINRYAYRVGKPRRFDVVVFKQSNREHSFYDVKRVIGLPGETVQIDEGGQIFIDGELLEETVQVEPMKNRGLAEEGVVLDEGEYFVLGDNRNQSEDSRFANVGNVIESDIVGKAWIRLEPFSFVKDLNVIHSEGENDGTEGDGAGENDSTEGDGAGENDGTEGDGAEGENGA